MVAEAIEISIGGGFCLDKFHKDPCPPLNEKKKKRGMGLESLNSRENPISPLNCDRVCTAPSAASGLWSRGTRADWVNVIAQ